MPPENLTLTNLVLLIQAIIVVGGGFYFAGRLGAKMDSLTNAINRLGKMIEDHEQRLRNLEAG